MYESVPRIQIPADNVSLWRYMDVARFLDFIHKKALYFASVAELTKIDSWEFELPIGFRHFLDNVMGEFGPQLYSDAASETVVNCWHENETESLAMWRLYTSGAEGVAINSTVGRMKNALGQEPLSVWIGKVLYTNDETDQNWQNTYFLEPIFHKRAAFAHEREIRAVISKWRDNSSPLKDRLKLSPRREGHFVPVDLSILVRRIVVSPTFPKWALDGLNAVIERTGFFPFVAELSELSSPNRVARGTSTKNSWFLAAAPNA